ncbi:MAG: DNA repair protein RadA [Spirochaetaceae bacterium]|nr:MAG: DNA repair protein RadA [Spirochaetaceae bacterium]
MAKRLSFHICRSCGHRESRWLGQCPSCGEWNTLEERDSPVRTGAGAGAGAGGKGRAVSLSRPLREIDPEEGVRLATGIGELDRALGGGMMPGSTILIGGEPGIGKSTLMMQAAGAVAAGAVATGRGATGRGARAETATPAQATVLYVSGEESAVQLRQRADRLGVTAPTLHILCTADLDTIQQELHRLRPRLVILDSVQTTIAPDAGSVPGTVNQIKYVTHELAEWTRENRTSLVMVAHVTKEGQIAGPRVVEHMVDAVLLFEHSGSDLRFLRATKNRFGAIEEVGLFAMDQRGLVEITDPGRVFLGGHKGELPAGVVAAPCYEGSRVLVVEIQALTVPAKGAVSRTFSDRIDNRRVSRVAAVLEKHLGVRFGDQDIYVNVAGGIRIQDVAIDLPLAIALYSARQGKALPSGTLATGELSLAGEVRPVSHRLQRLKASGEMGFRRLVGPPTGDGEESESSGNRQNGASWAQAATLPEAVAAAYEAFLAAPPKGV